MSRDASTEETALAWMNRTYPGLTPEGLSGLCALLAEPGRALIALDFDGTLAPIVLDPAQARALPAAVTALADLATLVGTLAVLTGRPARTAVEYAALDQVPGVVVLGHYGRQRWHDGQLDAPPAPAGLARSEEHTSELQSPCNLVCRLLLEKKKKKKHTHIYSKKKKKRN